MSSRLRFLLDTNILIPLQDSFVLLDDSLKNFVRLASVGGHQLLYHPSSEEDIRRDTNEDRRNRTLARLSQYQRLDSLTGSPRNSTATSPNDVCDNNILYALECEAAHALITEDKGIHSKAKAVGLGDRVYSIQTAEDWLKRLHEPKSVVLPNIDDVPLYSLTTDLSLEFFDSLREDYDFDGWFRSKAKEGRKAWIYRGDQNALGAICIYAVKTDEKINEAGEFLSGQSLKLCTFKVGELVRGRKIGELFLKAAFRYASENLCEHVFIHGNAEKQPYLAALLEEFGFAKRGEYEGDVVWVKEHPVDAPNDETLEPQEYVRRFFPHFRQDDSIGKHLIPIKAEYHELLFPDYVSQIKQQLSLFDVKPGDIGNAIKLAYLSHASTKKISLGDVVLFYRSGDEKVLTTIGVVDGFYMLDDPSKIASLVSRRTVYSLEEIEEMSKKKVKIILFRLIKHLPRSVSFEELKHLGILSGALQSATKLTESKYRSIVDASGI